QAQIYGQMGIILAGIPAVAPFMGGIISTTFGWHVNFGIMGAMFAISFVCIWLYLPESLWKLMQGKTTIVIAHRLSTLLHMDRILVFDQGRIVEDGAHTELLAHGGLYKTLWDAQVGGFLPDQKNEDEL